MEDIMLLREGYTVLHKKREACIKRIHYRDGLLEISYMDTEERAVVPLGEVEYVRQNKRK